MKKTINLLYALSYVLTIFSCKKECDVGFQSIHLKYLSKTYGHNLLFGDEKIYEFDSLKIFTNSNEIEYYDLTKDVDKVGDSILTIKFPQLNYQQIFVQFSSSQIDTLLFDMTYPNSGRCPISILENITSNRDSVGKLSYNEWAIYQ